MEPSILLCLFTCLFFLPTMLPLATISASSSTRPPMCHDHERSSLLQFKENFIADGSACSPHPYAYPKVASWKPAGAQIDCCSWDGVECDEVTGHVIGLDLSSGCLYGSINSTSSLFRLVHLRNLNLAFNDFNYSQIPSAIGRLSKLTYLNISSSYFSGQVPSNVSDLFNLSSLDLSLNDQLVLKKPDFGGFVNNLTSLEVLRLQGMDLSSTVPDVLANLSLLSILDLAQCGLHGEFPNGIFHLPKLEILDLHSNQDLAGHMPEFQASSPLREFLLADTSFSGEIPASIGNLNSLTIIDLFYCNFSGKLPSSLGNLTQLSQLDFSWNAFSAQSTSSLTWVSTLTKLTTLYLEAVNLSGDMPSTIANLTELSTLDLRKNELTGPIPPWLFNLTQLRILDLFNNKMHGPMPKSITNHTNLEDLNLARNKISGTVEWDAFQKLRNLHAIDLSKTNISLVINNNSSTTVQKFTAIGFGACNLNEFPDFLRHQGNLQYLDLMRNNIRGQIPKWIWNMSTETLELIDLSENFLTGFEVHPLAFPWVRAAWIDLSFNMLQATLPNAPPTIEALFVQGNKLTGELLQSFCNLTSLSVLSLYDNNFSGILPSCLAKTNLELLDLGRNNFHGIIPLTFTGESILKMIRLSENQLRGQLPRSLANCSMLEFLDVGNNRINDVFPSWLGGLINLKVLILSSNQFHGEVGGLKTTKFQFSNLRIIDLSQNNFIGQLPAHQFLNWIAMKMENPNETTYMGLYPSAQGSSFAVDLYFYSMAMTNKGTRLKYNKILDFFIAVDLSCNKFGGDIPQVIRYLHGLRLLNLSNNNLSGPIPPTLGDLTLLESLDLSQNNISGEIPQQLTQLKFLAAFNVSQNHLIGPIPQGKQFDTFQNDSYEGNWGLCGNPLSRKCGNLEALPPTGLEDDQGLGSPSGFGWKPVVIGYSCGLIIGVVIGHIVGARGLEWFANTFRPKQRRATGRRLLY